MVLSDSFLIDCPVGQLLARGQLRSKKRVMEIREDALIAVVGAGTMGNGIAQVAAAAGHPVVVIDRDASALERGVKALAASLGGLVKRGRLDATDADAIAARVRWSTDSADTAKAKLAIEAIVERLDIKRALFAELASTMAADAILASNTSSLSIMAMADGLPHPERFLGLHFFNPVPAMKLVEVVAGEATAPAIAEAATALIRRWGKRAVAVRDVPGFIVNRVARPFYAEAFVALGEGIAPETIDAALTTVGGFRMGPLTLADLIGHDINFAAVSLVYEGMAPHTRFRPQPAQARLVETGMLGRKSGRGVYDYSADLPAIAPIEPGTPAPLRLPHELGTLAPLASLLHGETDASLAPGIMLADDIRIAMGDGRALAERDDADVLIDHGRDFATASMLVVTARDEEALPALAGALGKPLLPVPDRPGLIVLRTLAQLANGAVDAVRDGVAGADAIDEAMLYGANYPEGPLAWARRVGPDDVRAALAHIARATGDDLYTPAEGWDAL
jgi:3-hydroxybutyryl-CoA dehydrogenase